MQGDLLRVRGGSDKGGVGQDGGSGGKGLKSW